MRTANLAVFSAQSMGASANSSAFRLENLIYVAITAIWSAGASPVGTLKLQVSNDMGTDNIGTGVSNWVDMDDSLCDVTGNTGSQVWDLSPTGFRWIRVVYTRTSGSGTLDSTANGKGWA